jgi:hypothetical protein
MRNLLNFISCMRVNPCSGGGLDLALQSETAYHGGGGLH